MVKKNKDSKTADDGEEELYEYNPADFEDAGVYLGEDEYNVEEICDMKIENGKKVYFIKWDGYDYSQNTWEPIEHLTKVLYMVEKFEEDYAKNKSLMQMEKENPGYFPMDDKSELTESKHRKSHKARDLDDEHEVIFKKKKLASKDDKDRHDDKGNKIKSSNKEGKESHKAKKEYVKGISASDQHDDDGIQEILMYKEDLDLAKKRKDKKPPKTLVKEHIDDLPTRAESIVSSNIDKHIKETVPEPKPTISDAPLRENKQATPKEKNYEVEPGKIVFRKAKESVEESANTSFEPKPTKQAPFNINKEPTKTLKTAPSKKIKEKHAPPRKKDKTGSFRNKDRPKAVLSIKGGKDGGLVFLVEWHSRSDGTHPDNSLVTSEDMKLNDPYFLIDFYESKLVQINKKEKKRKDREKAAKSNGLIEHMNLEDDQEAVPGIEMNQSRKLTENKVNKRPETQEAQGFIAPPAGLNKEIRQENREAAADKEIDDLIDSIDNFADLNSPEANFSPEFHNDEEDKVDVETEPQNQIVAPTIVQPEESNEMNSEQTERDLNVNKLVEKPLNTTEKMTVEESQKDKEQRTDPHKELNNSEANDQNKNGKQGSLVSVGS